MRERGEGLSQATGLTSQFLLPTTLNVDANFIKINFFYDVSSSFSFYLQRVRVKKITAKHFCPLAAPVPWHPFFPVGSAPDFHLPILPAHFSIFPHHRHSGFYGCRGFYGSAIGSFPSDQRGLVGDLRTASNLNTCTVDRE